VLVSSHLLSEIEQVATHVGMMAGGKLVRQGRLAEVLADGAPTLRISTPDIDTAVATLVAAGLQPSSVEGDEPTVLARLGSTAVEDVAAALVQAGVRLRGLSVDRPDLEDLFVSITGEGFDVLR
jgi:ABC-2 type transport system ATP-binding protein